MMLPMQCSAAVILCASLLLPAMSRAQAGEAGQRRTAPRLETEIESITVVAQKREENIQEVPISVTALTAESLARRGVTDVISLSEAIPNLRITQTFMGSSSTTVAIRGVAQGSPTQSLQTAAGLYVDGVYIAKVVGSNLDLEDLERVEVLRGPQGTLYGRNTIAGAVNFITKKPAEERAITVRTEAGNFDYFKGRVMFNIPLVGEKGFVQSDALGTLSLRQNVMYKTHAGYFRNQSPTELKSSGGSEFEDLNRIFTMSQVRWQPTKAFTLDYAFEYHRYRGGSPANQVSFVVPGSATSATGPFNITPYVRPNRADAIGGNAFCEHGDLTRCVRLQQDGNHRLHMLTAEYDLGDIGPLGSVKVKSIAGYRKLFQTDRDDYDASPRVILDSGADWGVEHWSEELQLIGVAPRFNYVIGGYYYGERSSQTALTNVFNYANVSFGKHTNSAESFAPYGQATWTPPILADRLSLTLGIRYTQEQTHVDGFRRCIRALGPGGVNLCNQPGRPLTQQDWDRSVGKGFGGAEGISPNASVVYQWTNDLMTYVRVARGFKSGGFSGTVSDPRLLELSFDPEQLLQYEAGFKSQWLNNRLRVNGSGFYSDYTDLQQTVRRTNPEGGLISLTSNVDSAEIWGAELELAMIPLRGVEVSATYGLTLGSFGLSSVLPEFSFYH